ncbi:MAG TPA: hypothetical protein VLK29_07030 [Luteimonas sp.]|nr:hypothetical protein [Luteimonas sp.]
MTAPKAAKAAKAPQRRTSREGGDSQAQKRLTSERITSDLEEFARSGGHVEKLGVTRVLTRVDAPASAPKAAAPAK